MVNVREIARIANVSPSTVSRVLNNNPNVNEETRAHVLEITKELGYSPRKKANKQRKKRIGIIIPKMTANNLQQHPTIFSIMSYFIESLTKNNYNNSLVVLDENFNVNHVKEYDGLLITGTGGNEEDYLISEMEYLDIPFVIINRFISEKEANYVNIDGEHSIFSAGQYLIELGHKAIALINGNINFRNSITRAKGYKNVLIENNIEINQDYIKHGEYTEESGEKLCNELLALRQIPSAIIATSDTIAIGAMKAIKRAGMRIPQDISIIGFGDIPLAEQISPSLTTIKMPTKDIGEEAAIILDHLIKKPIVKNIHVLVHTELIKRESCSEAHY